MRHGLIEAHSPCMWTSLAPIDTPCPSNPPHANIGFEPLTSRYNSPTTLITNPTTELRVTHNIANTNHTIKTQAQHPKKYHINIHMPTNPTLNQHHAPTLGTTHRPDTYPYTHITRTPNTHKTPSLNRASLHQTKNNTNTYSHPNHMGGGIPNTPLQRTTKTI
jgi:hypothetical protein